MKSKALLLMLALVTTPVLADNILSRALDFGRELLDETRKLAPGIQQDHSAAPARQASAHPNDGRDLPALEPVTAPRPAPRYPVRPPWWRRRPRPQPPRPKTIRAGLWKRII
ncbi:hypothetical protein MBH78_17775 [Oceanimonas sp. NS1]|nr:hypothetical protein [Oceanimonas sp. NS1]